MFLQDIDGQTPLHYGMLCLVYSWLFSSFLKLCSLYHMLFIIYCSLICQLFSEGRLTVVCTSPIGYMKLVNCCIVVLNCKQKFALLWIQQRLCFNNIKTILKHCHYDVDHKTFIKGEKNLVKIKTFKTYLIKKYIYLWRLWLMVDWVTNIWQWCCVSHIVSACISRESFAVSWSWQNSDWLWRQLCFGRRRQCWYSSSPCILMNRTHCTSLDTANMFRQSFHNQQLRVYFVTG